MFPAVAIPDLFMQRMIDDKDWTVFDPKEIEKKTGKRLENHW